MEIRSYSNDDYASLLAIYSLAKLDEFRFEKSVFELLPLEEDRQRSEEIFSARILVCEKLNQVMGFGAIDNDEVIALFVHPEARGKGIGEALLDQLIFNHAEKITIQVAKSNKVAKSLYKKYGFRVISEFESSYNGKPVIANGMQLLQAIW